MLIGSVTGGHSEPRGHHPNSKSPSGWLYQQSPGDVYVMIRDRPIKRLRSDLTHVLLNVSFLRFDVPRSQF